MAVHFKVNGKHLTDCQTKLPHCPCLLNNLGGFPPAPPPNTPMLISSNLVSTKSWWRRGIIPAVLEWNFHCTTFYLRHKSLITGSNQGAERKSEWVACVPVHTSPYMGIYGDVWTGTQAKEYAVVSKYRSVASVVKSDHWISYWGLGTRPSGSTATWSVIENVKTRLQLATGSNIILWKNSKKYKFLCKDFLRSASF